MIKNKRVLKRTNKYSGETGYVGTVSKKKGYFTNEPDVLKAKRYTYAFQITISQAHAFSVGLFERK